MNLSNSNTALHSSIFFSSQPVGVLQKKRWIYYKTKLFVVCQKLIKKFRNSDLRHVCKPSLQYELFPWQLH